MYVNFMLTSYVAIVSVVNVYMLETIYVLSKWIYVYIHSYIHTYIYIYIYIYHMYAYNVCHMYAYNNALIGAIRGAQKRMVYAYWRYIYIYIYIYIYVCVSVCEASSWQSCWVTRVDHQRMVCMYICIYVCEAAFSESCWVSDAQR
jgi:hypothetical protein